MITYSHLAGKQSPALNGHQPMGNGNLSRAAVFRLTRPAACPRKCNAQIGLIGALITPAVTTATRGQWHPHFCVPHSLTEPLAGALPQAELEVFYYELSPHQHLSDLHRVRCLAETHPQIESVRIHKAGKQYAIRLQRLWAC